ncbi:MAG: hypothetical protein ABR970_05760 [Roseiarcus sp.]
MIFADDVELAGVYHPLDDFRSCSFRRFRRCLGRGGIEAGDPPNSRPLDRVRGSGEGMVGESLQLGESLHLRRSIDQRLQLSRLFDLGRAFHQLPDRPELRARRAFGGELAQFAEPGVFGALAGKLKRRFRGARLPTGGVRRRLFPGFSSPVRMGVHRLSLSSFAPAIRTGAVGNGRSFPPGPGFASSPAGAEGGACFRPTPGIRTSIYSRSRASVGLDPEFFGFADRANRRGGGCAVASRLSRGEPGYSPARLTAAALHGPDP